MNKVITKGHWPRTDTARPTLSLTLVNETAQHMDASAYMCTHYYHVFFFC